MILTIGVVVAIVLLLVYVFDAQTWIQGHIPREQSQFQKFNIGPRMFSFAAQKIASAGFTTNIVVMPGDDRLLVLQKNGTILQLPEHVEFDIKTMPGGESFTSSGGEEGLLFGLPRDADHVYITFTVGTSGADGAGGTHMVLGELNLRERIIRRILTLAYPKNNHHSGALVYGSSGVSGPIYMSSGDGGQQGDPNGYGQDDNTHLGKILRVNPNDGSWTIIAKGVRNPWTMSTARGGRDLFIADVGWSTSESIYYVPDFESTGTPWNLGWSKFEGSVRLKNIRMPKWSATVHPIFEYPTSKEYGRCVIGGFWKPELNSYVFADLTGIMKAITPFLDDRELTGGLDAVMAAGSRVVWKETGFQRIPEPDNPEYKAGSWWIHSLSNGPDSGLYIAGTNGLYNVEPFKK